MSKHRGSRIQYRESSTNPPFSCKTNPICTNSKFALTPFFAKVYAKNTQFSPPKANPIKLEAKRRSAGRLADQSNPISQPPPKNQPNLLLHKGLRNRCENLQKESPIPSRRACPYLIVRGVARPQVQQAHRVFVVPSIIFNGQVHVLLLPLRRYQLTVPPPGWMRRLDASLNTRSSGQHSK
jgi:hypothetical protein